MGRDPADQAAPDLFSATNAIRGDSPSPTKPIAAAEPVNKPSQRHILPKNLRHAVKQLSDGELDELFGAAFDEAKRRGRLPRNVETDLPAPPSRRPSELATNQTLRTDKRRKVDTAEVSLTQGQVNAVRAAFKAGVTPSRIARQFGISQSNIRKALASDPSK